MATKRGNTPSLQAAQGSVPGLRLEGHLALSVLLLGCGAIALAAGGCLACSLVLTTVSPFLSFLLLFARVQVACVDVHRAWVVRCEVGMFKRVVVWKLHPPPFPLNQLSHQPTLIKDPIHQPT